MTPLEYALVAVLLVAIGAFLGYRAAFRHLIECTMCEAFVRRDDKWCAGCQRCTDCCTDPDHGQ